MRRLCRGRCETTGLPGSRMSSYFFTFAVTLFGRACGAVIFGHYADRIGRRRTTVIGIAGFYLLGLPSFMPYVFTPMVLLVVAGGLIMTGGLLGPETRDVELHARDLGQPGSVQPRPLPAE